MAFYGQSWEYWTNMAAENPDILWGLRHNIASIIARKRLELIDNIAIAMSTEDEGKSFKITLAQQAFDQDDPALAYTIEALSRKAK